MMKHIKLLLLAFFIVFLPIQSMAWDNTKPTAGDSSTTPHELDTKIVNVGEDLYDNAAEKDNVLELDNTTVFTPDADYEPATKKYVDDAVVSAIDADNVNIDDAGNIITATEVEGALQENRTAIDLNTAKDTNVSTALSAGTVNATSYGITSDGGADDIVLPEADTTNAGLLGADKWDDIVTSTTHNTSTGADHTYIDQDVTTTNTPTFTGLQVTPATAPAHSEGLLFYDSDQKTFVTYNDISTVSQNIGEETWVRAVNKTGGALSNGDVVYVDTAQGNRPTIAEAKADAHATACGTIGVVTQTTIADNAEGMITAFGIVRGYNTSGFSAGDELFLSAGTAGLIVNVAPSSPNFRVRIGWALNSTVSGDVFVNPKVFPHADKIYIDDAGSIITATDTEGALQEHRTAIDLNTAKDTNVTTNLSEGTSTETTVDVNSSDGTNATLVSASTSRAGLLTKAKFDEIVANTAKESNSSDAVLLARANHTGTQATSTIILPTINSVLTAEEQCSLLCASSHYEGGAFTDNADGSITVAAGKGFIRASNVAGAQLLSFEWAEDTNVSLVDESTNYIYASYHATTPTINASTSKPTDVRKNVLLGKVYRHGIHAHLFKAGMVSDEFLAKIIGRFTQVEGEITHASGGVISETGTRNIASTAAVVWGGLTRGTTTEKDTSGADTFHYYYYTGAAWTYSDISQIDNLQYNNPASGLATLANNQYGVHWVYLDPDGHVIIVYGQDSYTLGDAQDAQPIASLPGQVSEFCWLAAKVIIEKSAATFTEIQSAYDTAYVASTASVHNELGGLHGGAADDYYHLTGANATDLTDGGDSTLHYHNLMEAIAATVASVDAVAVYYGRVADDDDPTWIDKDVDFPTEYLLVAIADEVKVYDVTDASITTHETYDYTGYTVTDVKMVNGLIVVGTTTGIITENVITSESGWYDTSSTPAIVNNAVNAIALTRLSDAPINPATGMRYVTIDAFTDGGTSRITRDSSGDEVVYDLVDTASDTHIDGAINPEAESIAVNTTDPAIDIYEEISTDTNTVDRTYGAATTPALLSAPSAASKIVAYDSVIIHGNADGLTVIDENPSTPAEGAVAYITKDYNTGMMRGDIQLATLADTTAGAVTTTIDDRCVQGNDLTVTGTLTKAAVATGAELMGWSGWNHGGEYATLPYSSDFDTGTGDIRVSCWIKGTDTYGSFVDCLSLETGFLFGVSTGIRLIIGATTVTGTVPTDTSQWFKVEGFRRSGITYIAVNGEIDNSGACTDDMSHSQDLYFGCSYGATGTTYAGKIALLHISKTAPTAEQIKADYLKELPMFQENAAITLSGSSNSVLALDYDDITENVTVLTDVVDVFNGLANISQDTLSGTGQCVSVGNGTTLIGTSTTVTFAKPAINLREELAKQPDQLAQFGYVPQLFWFSGDGAETDFDLPAGYDVFAVYSVGLLKKEGSGDDYTVTDNGNNKMIVFGTAPFNGVDICIMGVVK